MPVIFHRLATQEFVKARRWYARRSLQAEARFVAALAVALRAAENNPLLASKFQANYRWKRLQRFPYVIYFEPLPGATIYIYAIAHGKQRQGYWLRRVTRP